MDSSFTVKPRDSLSRAPAVRNTVRTDLSPSQSVNATQPVAAQHHGPADAGMREPAIGPQCQSLLDREREERERRRARKDEALLRQRAYGGKAEKPDPESQASPHADFEV